MHLVLWPFQDVPIATSMEFARHVQLTSTYRVDSVYAGMLIELSTRLANVFHAAKLSADVLRVQTLNVLLAQMEDIFGNLILFFLRVRVSVKLPTA